MDGMNDRFKSYNQTKRSLTSDSSLSYLEPSEFNVINKRIGYIQERLKIQNQNHLLTEALDSPTCMEEVSKIQEEINDINTDLSTLQDKNLSFHTESDNSNAEIHK